MGAKPAIRIQTPEFQQSDWEYQPPQNQNNPEYGVYRTLSNRKTGQMIDEYDMSWVTQQQYSYYLKSFNWRYNQPNVVNTRFIVQKNRHEFCSQTFVARIYIEHVIVRLNQINDIPYPQNLYVLMQALEGYAKIFEHSKYFVAEEKQICVDAQGNVKIWVNSDLSINYPNSDRNQTNKNIGEEMMVEKLVHMIAQNTDKDSEPQMTFLDYFEEKKGFKGIKFEEARVLVKKKLQRLNEAQIPDKFEAVLNLANEDQLTEQQNDHPQEALAIRHDYKHQVEEETPQWGRYNSSARFQEEGYRSPPHHIAVIPPPVAHQHYIQPQYAAPYPPYAPYSYHANPAFSIGPQPQISMAFGGYPTQPVSHPIQYIPHYTRVQYPIRVGVQPSMQIPLQVQQPQFQLINVQRSDKQLRRSEEPNKIYKQMDSSRKEKQESNIEKRQSKSKFSEVNSQRDLKEHPSNENDIHGIPLNNQYANRGENYPENILQIPPNSSFLKQNQATGYNGPSKPQHQYKNYISSAQLSEVDDFVAKSLPIKAGYPASKNAPLLNSFGQSDRSAFSHIQSKEHGDSFGLSASGLLKLKDSMQEKLNDSVSKGKQKLGTKGSTIVKLNSKKSVKYYYSLQEQLQIDPDIAADLQRYLAR